MRTLTILVVSAITSVPWAAADDWTWAPIKDGKTLDAHLARADFARPNPLLIFEILKECCGATRLADDSRPKIHD